MSVNYLSLIETGKREPTLSFLKRVSQELRVPIGFFFLEDSDFGELGDTNEDFTKLRKLLLEIQKLITAKAMKEDQR